MKEKKHLKKIAFNGEFLRVNKIKGKDIFMNFL